MKLVIASGSALLMLAAFGLRASSERAGEPARKAPAPAAPEVRDETPKTSAAPARVVETAAAPEKAVAPTPAVVRAEKVDGPGMPDARRIAAELTRELGLSALQRSAVESILADREREIQAYFAEIRARKVFTLEDWSARMKGIKEGAYRRIDALLDAEQRASFAALLDRGGLKDTIAFKIPDDVVNLDDFKD